jgi:hypothetical protein
MRSPLCASNKLLGSTGRIWQEVRALCDEAAGDGRLRTITGSTQPPRAQPSKSTVADLANALLGVVSVDQVRGGGECVHHLVRSRFAARAADTLVEEQVGSSSIERCHAEEPQFLADDRETRRRSRQRASDGESGDSQCCLSDRNTAVASLNQVNDQYASIERLQKEAQ